MFFVVRIPNRMGSYWYGSYLILVLKYIKNSPKGHDFDDFGIWMRHKRCLLPDFFPWAFATWIKPVYLKGLSSNDIGKGRYSLWTLLGLPRLPPLCKQKPMPLVSGCFFCSWTSCNSWILGVAFSTLSLEIAGYATQFLYEDLRQGLQMNPCCPFWDFFFSAALLSLKFRGWCFWLNRAAFGQ